jgi:hypothetical protein
MKINQWTLGLAAAGVVSLASAVQAEEAANQVMTAVSATTLSGYVDTSIQWRPGTASPGGATTGVGGVNGVANAANKQDGFNLNVIKLRLEKALDESEWAAGYRAELLFGPDAVGYNTSVPGAGVSDFSIKDAYVELRAPIGNGLDFKLGSFSCLMGYEVYESGDNANYTRSYAWQSEPTQHTGLLAAYKVNDILSLKAGVANSYNAGVNARTAKPTFFGSGRDETRKTYMASFTLTAPESMGAFKGATLTGAATKGFNGAFFLPAVSDTVGYYVGLTTPTGLEGLTVGASYDYSGSTATAVSVFGPIASSYFNATAIYTSYQASEKLKLNLRGEYATSTGGVLSAMTGGSGFVGGASKGEKVLAATLTTDYALWANVVSRLELRWDHDCSNKTDGSLFDLRSGAVASKNQVLVALNVIYKF